MKQIPKNPVLCACGCGTVVWNGCSYKKGHTWIGRHHTKEAKEKNANAHKEIHNSPPTEFKKGLIPWNKGKKGLQESWNKGKTNIFSKTTLKRMSEIRSGRTPWNKGKPHMQKEKHPFWKGGQKLAWARSGNKKRKRGFILLVPNNPYNEPIDYHHIHPNLPYVVPCPKRIHIMFNGHEKTHFENVNAMLGFRFEEAIK